jgi:hypothetical protein
MSIDWFYYYLLFRFFLVYFYLLSCVYNFFGHTSVHSSPTLTPNLAFANAGASLCIIVSGPGIGIGFPWDRKRLFSIYLVKYCTVPHRARETGQAFSLAPLLPIPYPLGSVLLATGSRYPFSCQMY